MATRQDGTKLRDGYPIDDRIPDDDSSRTEKHRTSIVWSRYDAPVSDAAFGNETSPHKPIFRRFDHAKVTQQRSVPLRTCTQ